ncbi:hypothetical protein [Congzhengia minquanensis]|uniref:Uncharacterized protein n=1 Tax=Congzhengia minquanensis TaxID=2763657 RepID=A0A926DP08_9FIRM|nr:hypothetical protein [Congzhengia minquanensis]MBC8541376.1 hypothetical protein [Congzhengia minquanensis]
MKNCYITAAEKFSKFDLLLFRCFGCKRLLKKNMVNKNGLNVIKIPLPPKMKEKQKKRYFTRFCAYLHDMDVQTICVQNIQDHLLQYYLRCEFQIMKGSAIFYEMFQDFLTYFAEKKGYHLNECDLVLISNNPKEVKKYMLKCVRIVKAISVYTTNPGKFENLANEFREKYGIFIHIKGKNDKVKKYNKIYINCEADRIVDEGFFQSVNLIDIYKIYKGGFSEILLSYKTNEEEFLKENRVIKNLSFTEFYFKIQQTNIDKITIPIFLKDKNYKIVNIRK